MLSGNIIGSFIMGIWYDESISRFSGAEESFMCLDNWNTLIWCSPVSLDMTLP